MGCLLERDESGDCRDAVVKEVMAAVVPGMSHPAFEVCNAVLDTDTAGGMLFPSLGDHLLPPWRDLLLELSVRRGDDLAAGLGAQALLVGGGKNLEAELVGDPIDQAGIASLGDVGTAAVSERTAEQ